MKNIELKELKNNPNYKLAWIPSWNKEIDPPTYIFEEKRSWMFKKQSDDNINTYVRFENLNLPTNLIY